MSWKRTSSIADNSSNCSEFAVSAGFGRREFFHRKQQGWQQVSLKCHHERASDRVAGGGRRLRFLSGLWPANRPASGLPSPGGNTDFRIEHSTSTKLRYNRRHLDSFGSGTKNNENAFPRALPGGKPLDGIGLTDVNRHRRTSKKNSELCACPRRGKAPQKAASRASAIWKSGRHWTCR